MELVQDAERRMPSIFHTNTLAEEGLTQIVEHWKGKYQEKLIVVVIWSKIPLINFLEDPIPIYNQTL